MSQWLRALSETLCSISSTHMAIKYLNYFVVPWLPRARRMHIVHRHTCRQTPEHINKSILLETEMKGCEG